MTEEHPHLPVLWVVGAGGLLGSSVVAAAATSGTAEVWAPPRPVAWVAADATRVSLEEMAREFLAHAAGRPWWVAWCAGAGVSGTSAADLAREVDAFAHLLTSLREAGAGPEGSVFLASSAGGVYAGSADPPFDEATVPVSISPYGDAKLALEALARDFQRDTASSLLIGRIANLFGPGQDLSKPQGIISQLCRAHLLHRPLSIYVPLDTMRSYVYAPDCGAMVVAGLRRLDGAAAGGGRSVVKVMAAPHAVSVGFVVSEFARVVKRRPLVTFGSSSTSAFQARDLRVRSSVWPELDALAATPFVVGLTATLEHLRRSVALGRLA